MYKELYKKAAADAGGYELADPRKDRKGAYSSQIATFSLENKGTCTISYVLDMIPKIHQKFLENVLTSTDLSK